MTTANVAMTIASDDPAFDVAAFASRIAFVAFEDYAPDTEEGEREDGFDGVFLGSLAINGTEYGDNGAPLRAVTSGHAKTLAATNEQTATLVARGLDLVHATQPAGEGTALYIYDADDFVMTLNIIDADGTITVQQRAFSPYDGWDDVEGGDADEDNDEDDSDQESAPAPVSASLFEPKAIELADELLARALALGTADREGGKSEKWGGAVWATLTGGNAAECPAGVAVMLGDKYHAGYGEV